MNKYDTLIESLKTNFAGIVNLELLKEPGPGKNLFEGIVRRIAELNSIKTLYINYYIPSAQKATNDDMREISESKYKDLLPVTEKDLKENYFETVRFGYVAAYHKYEIFIKELLINAEKQFSHIFTNKISLEKYIEKEMEFIIKDPSYSPRLHKINYICNCTKHYDGYPRKTNKPNYFMKFSEDEKLEFSQQDLEADIDFLLIHFSSLAQTVIQLSSHQMLKEHMLPELIEITEVEKEEVNSKWSVVNDNAKRLIETLKVE